MKIKCEMMKIMWLKFGILDFYFQGFLSNTDVASQSECFRILSGQWANKLSLEKAFFILLYYISDKQQIDI